MRRAHIRPGYANMFGTLYQFKPKWSHAKHKEIDQNIFLREKRPGSRLVKLMQRGFLCYFSM